MCVYYLRMQEVFACVCYFYQRTTEKAKLCTHINQLVVGILVDIKKMLFRYNVKFCWKCLNLEKCGGSSRELVCIIFVCYKSKLFQVTELSAASWVTIAFLETTWWGRGHFTEVHLFHEIQTALWKISIRFQNTYAFTYDKNIKKSDDDFVRNECMLLLHEICAPLPIFSTKN